MAHYGLDYAHFFTLPGLAWKGCLKKTNIRLALLSDPDMLLMFERGIRGGITQAVHRYTSAKNAYVESKYNPNQESTYIQYLNANNLCGWEMSQPFPTCGFKWVDIQIHEISELAKLKNKGYLLEVDVSHPRSLYDSHNDLPFMCEKISMNGVEKLVPNLRSKRFYIIHIRALDQALKHGLVLERIHREIEFNQYPWMKTYIDFNTKPRMAAANDFEKDFLS